MCHRSKAVPHHYQAVLKKILCQKSPNSKTTAVGPATCHYSRTSNHSLEKIWTSKKHYFFGTKAKFEKNLEPKWHWPRIVTAIVRRKSRVPNFVDPAIIVVSALCVLLSPRKTNIPSFYQ